MKRLDSLSGAITLTAAGNLQSLTAKNLPQGEAVDKFFLKLGLTLVRGPAPLAHVPQAISQIVNRLVISHGRMNWSVRGDMIHLIDTLQRLDINSMGPLLGPADLAYTMYLPIDPSPAGPPYSKANHFRTEELQDMTMDITFVNPFNADSDVTVLTATVELWATFCPVPADQKTWTSVFRQQDTFQGNVVSINDMVPSIWLGLGFSPANFDRCNIQASNMDIAINCDGLDLDAPDYFYQYLQPLNAATLTQGGNQFLRSVPQADGTVLDFHKVFDARNHPKAKLPISVEYATIAAQFGYVVKGYGR